jgi:hypothetical protein
MPFIDGKYYSFGKRTPKNTGDTYTDLVNEGVRKREAEWLNRIRASHRKRMVEEPDSPIASPWEMRKNLIEPKSSPINIKTSAFGKLAIRDGSDLRVFFEMIAKRAGDNATLGAFEADDMRPKRQKDRSIPLSENEQAYKDKFCGQWSCWKVCGRLGLLGGENGER